MSFNGLMIFALEMPLVGYFERTNTPKVKIILWGSVFMAASFLVLLTGVWLPILVFSVFLLTIGEMFSFPFSNSFAMSRAPRGHEGRYMALYTMTFSLAHIVSSKTGMEIIDSKGFDINWLVMGSIGIVTLLALIILHRMVLKENS